jgi:Fur family peroxide stress response transcriptional regulator
MHTSADRQPDAFELKRTLLEDIYRRKGQRLTHQRLEILREISTATDHPSAETVFDRVRARVPPLSLDTVYRSLAAFERLGLVERVPADTGQARYDPDTSFHHHLVCERCGQVADLPSAGLDLAEVLERAAVWGTVRDVRLILRGTCASCRAAAKPDMENNT